MNEPIFILGLSRSGTTLLADMLDRHSNIAIYPESHFFDLFNEEGMEVLDSEYKIKRAIAKIKNIKQEGLSEDEIIKRFKNTDKAPRALFDILLKLKMEKTNKKRFGEKTPKHFMSLSTLLKYYPDAKMVYIFRDPRNIYSSFKKTQMFKKINFIGRNIIERSLLWNMFTIRIKDYCAKDKLDQFHCIKFEELLKEPEVVARRLCEFIDEEYDSNILSVKNNISSFSASIGKRGINKDAENRMNYLSKREILLIEFICGKYILQEGYKLLILQPFIVNFLDAIKFYWMQDFCYLMIRNLRKQIKSLFKILMP